MHDCEGAFIKGRGFFSGIDLAEAATFELFCLDDVEALELERIEIFEFFFCSSSFFGPFCNESSKSTSFDSCKKNTPIKEFLVF